MLHELCVSQTCRIQSPPESIVDLSSIPAASAGVFKGLQGLAWPIFLTSTPEGMRQTVLLPSAALLQTCICATYSPGSPALPPKAYANLQGSTGGTNQKRMAAQWPALKKSKISQTVFTLDPCALRPFHVHQRADGLLYVISGEVDPPTRIQSPLCVHSFTCTAVSMAFVFSRMCWSTLLPSCPTPKEQYGEVACSGFKGSCSPLGGHSGVQAHPLQQPETTQESMRLCLRGGVAYCAGSKFVVGFVTEENKPVVNEISTGASAVFPVGALLPSLWRPLSAALTQHCHKHP